MFYLNKINLMNLTGKQTIGNVFIVFQIYCVLIAYYTYIA